MVCFVLLGCCRNGVCRWDWLAVCKLLHMRAIAAMQAYMLADTLFFLLPFTPSDILFMGHHAMTSTYMAAALALHRGGISVMVLMAIGESTSIFQNSWIIARNCRHDNKVRFLH